MAITNVLLGSVTVNALNITATKVPGTIKQKMGNNLVQFTIPERTTKDWRVLLTAELISADKDTDRTTIEGYDDLSIITYEDGIHNGSYIIIPGSLQFVDTGNNVNAIYGFSVELIQYNQ